MRRASLFVAAVVLVAGCGGGGKRLSKAEYASKADALCAKYNQQTKSFQSPSNLSELANAADKTLPILDNAIKDFHKLKPPASEQGVVDQWLAQIDNLKADLTEIRDKARTNDLQGIQAIAPRAQRHNARSNALATQLGMTVCSRD